MKKNSIFFILLTILVFFATMTNCHAYRAPEVTRPSEIPRLILDLKNGDEDTRVHAAYRLGLVNPPESAGEAISTLIAALNDPSVQVRIHSASALGDLKAEAAIQPLIDHLSDADGEVIVFAAQSLGEIGPKALSAVPYLLPLLESDGCAGSRRVAAIALGRIGSEQELAATVMTRDLHNTNKYVRLEAARALEIIGPPARDAVPELRKLIKDPEKQVGLEACRALRDIGTPEAQEALLDYEKDCTDIFDKIEKK